MINIGLNLFNIGLRHCKKAVNVAFKKHLLITNVGLSATLSCTGDLIVQRYENSQTSKNKLDFVRCSQMTASGVTVGIFCHYWYIFLDARVPGRTLRAVLTKVLLDGIVCSPLYITCFFATTCFLEGKSIPQFTNELIYKGSKLFLADCVVWPPAQLVNFYLIPLRYRVLFDNCVSLGCDIYTSHVKHEDD